MKKLFVGAALAAAVAAPVQAQQSMITGQPTIFTITPYVGYMIFGDHFETGNDVEFSNDNGPIYGVQAGINMTPNIALVGNFGYAPTNYTFENLGGAGTDIDGADVGIWLYDANLQFGVPIFAGMSTFKPFAQAGVGAVKFTAEEDDFGSNGDTNIAYNVGLGADWQVMGLGLRVMAKDYISSFAWDDFKNANDPNDIEDSAISHNFALSVGLKLAF